MSQAGIASRRHAEEMITRGEVRVNGQVVTELGTRIDPARDKVTVSGKRAIAERHVYFLLNKPRGCVTTRSDPEKRKTVMDFLNVDERIYPIGRLDFNTEGVLLLTNDGALANGLMHPKREVKKTYHVKVHGLFTPDDLVKLKEGITLDDGIKTAPAEVMLVARGTSDRNGWLQITIHEGRNRQVHRMMEAIGHEVLRLERVSYAGLTTEGVAPGKFRPLLPPELAKLRRAAGVAQGVPERAGKKARAEQAIPERGRSERAKSERTRPERGRTERPREHGRFEAPNTERPRPERARPERRPERSKPGRRR